MIQLSPQETFPIVRNLEDPSDVTLYYIKAEIRISGNDNLIATVKLDHIGSAQRYRKNWNVLVPENTFIDIVTKVYTDSGYTTLSTNYGSQTDTYIVQTRWAPQFITAPSRIDYDQIKAMVTAAFEGIQIEAPDMGPHIEMAHNRLANKIRGMIQNIPFPPQELPDFSPVFTMLDKIAQRLEKLPQKEFDPSGVINDTAAVKELMVGIADTLARNHGENMTAHKGAAEAIGGQIGAHVEKHVEKLSDTLIGKHSENMTKRLLEDVKKTPVSIMFTPASEKEPIKSSFDPKRVAALTGNNNAA